MGQRQRGRLCGTAQSRICGHQWPDETAVKAGPAEKRARAKAKKPRASQWSSKRSRARCGRCCGRCGVYTAHHTHHKGGGLELASRDTAVALSPSIMLSVHNTTLSVHHTLRYLSSHHHRHQRREIERERDRKTERAINHCAATY